MRLGTVTVIIFGMEILNAILYMIRAHRYFNNQNCEIVKKKQSIAVVFFTILPYCYNLRTKKSMLFCSREIFILKIPNYPCKEFNAYFRPKKKIKEQNESIHTYGRNTLNQMLDNFTENSNYMQFKNVTYCEWIKLNVKKLTWRLLFMLNDIVHWCTRGIYSLFELSKCNSQPFIAVAIVLWNCYYIIISHVDTERERETDI